MGEFRTVLLERGERLGGVLEQCIHPGFGLHRYREELTGPEFAHRLKEELEDSGADVLTEATVLEISPNGPYVKVASPRGLKVFRPGAVVWAVGARERPFGALRIPGTRPSGVFTAGLAQRFLDLEGLLPGRRAVILGSGDIGLIMARRLHLEGVEVAAVLEIQPFPGGLTRNVVQCLHDFGIPLLLSHTVAEVHGKKRLTGITAVRVDEDWNPIPGTEKRFEVDTLILSVGLIPEVRLIEDFVALDPVNRGPRVNAQMQTEVPWLFSAGNCVAVFDLVDTVAALGERAGAAAARHVRGELPPGNRVPLVRGGNVVSLVPSALDGTLDEATVYLRVPRPMEGATVDLGGVVRRKVRVVRPAEMIEIPLNGDHLRELTRLPEIVVEVRPA